MPLQDQYPRPQPRCQSSDTQSSNTPLTMAEPSATMLVPPACADMSVVELRGQSLSHSRQGPSDPTAAPVSGDASQPGCANSECDAPNAAKTVATATPVVIEGGGRHPNLDRDSKTKGVSKPKKVLRDSACFVTPPSLLRPKAARPLPPSLSTAATPVSTDPRPEFTSHSVSSHRAAPVSHDDPADNATIVASPAATATRGSIDHGSPSQRAETTRSRYSKGLSQEELSNVRREEDRRVLQIALDSGAFKFPPKNTGETEKPRELPRRIPFRAPPPIGSIVTLKLTEARLDQRAEYWKPFVPRIEEERRQIAMVKQEALDRLASKMAIEKGIKQVRMSIKHRFGRMVCIKDSLPCLKVLLDSAEKADKDIANLHAEWRQRVINLNAFIEESLRPEYHWNEVEEERKAAQRAEDAKRAEYRSANRLAGWGELPYPDDLAPDQRLTPTTTQLVAVPAWFEAVDASGVVKLSGEHPEQRYTELLNTVHKLEARLEEEVTCEIKPAQESKKLRKQWHDPNQGWPHPNWQKHGGWWVCRTGPSATMMEKECTICPVKRDTGISTKQGPSQAKPTTKETYDKILAEVQKAMCLQMKKDKEAVKVALRREREVRQATVYRNGWDGYLPYRS
ncbi:hypothetical protein QBC34DRAFT_62099 [Podospora aff. communis PSN243]|uniref:RanBP2-type domain-containing protein n=1 Tax=Podospora aff. communis PSN243 TaxID=3040156 RepID=A0AAV9GVS9_9PEZI|nr:hypothetical protein QBC34DRAFT_62099 [Podospora aff. communis PSN243]